MRETIAILSDPEAVVQIADIAAGRLTDAADLAETMRARRRKQA